MLRTKSVLFGLWHMNSIEKDQVGGWCPVKNMGTHHDGCCVMACNELYQWKTIMLDDIVKTGSLVGWSTFDAHERIDAVK
jgi:hypothetical protein